MSAPSNSPTPESPLSASGLRVGQMVGGGRYLLKQILGQGGMGVVWLAHDTRLREAVALKFLPSQIAYDAAALDDLRRETMRSRRLSHPNIIRIHDLNEGPNEPPFISMEYVDGPNLHNLRAHRPAKVLSWKFLAPLVRQLCAGLDYAHGEGIVHRDLKPANLMLDTNERLKLADFGVACAVSDSLTRLSGQLFPRGTPDFMSPQQADGKKPRVSDDIYSLGATLYDLLTSRPPFYSGDIGYQVRHTRPEPMGQRLIDLELSNDIPSEVSALVMACLAKTPEQRPPSVNAILQWLDSAEVKAPAQVPGWAEADKSTVAPAAPRVAPLNVRAGSETGAPPEPGPPPHVLEGLIPPVPASSEQGEWSEERASDLENVDTPANMSGSPETEPELATSSGGVSSVASGVDEPAAGGTSASAPASRRSALPVVLTLAAIVALGALDWWLLQKKSPSSSTAMPASSLSPRRVEGPSNPEILFNGRDLTGWSGDPKYWSVQGGAITGQAPGNYTTRQPSFLIWKGRDLQDFELRLAVRFDGGNTGIYYRGRDLGDWNVGGYQFEIFSSNSGNLMDNGADRPRRDLARHQTGANLAVLFKKGVWNECVITAQGHRLTHQINGQIVADVIDPEPSSALSGILAFELYAGGTSVQFKDLRLKRLTPATASAEITSPTVAMPALDRFQELFNGRDLTGWNGDPRYWSVQNGTLVGRVPRTVGGVENVRLFSTEGDLGDFELHFSFRLGSGARNLSGWLGNYGVIYWERNQGGPFPLGFQYDIKGNGMGAMTYHLDRLTSLAYAGAAPEGIVRKGDWNEGVVIAQGRRIIHKLNGVTVGDKTATERNVITGNGVLGLTIEHHGGWDSFIQFADVRLKRFHP